MKQIVNRSDVASDGMKISLNIFSLAQYSRHLVNNFNAVFRFVVILLRFRYFLPFSDIVTFLWTVLRGRRFLFVFSLYTVRVMLLFHNILVECKGVLLLYVFLFLEESYFVCDSWCLQCSFSSHVFLLITWSEEVVGNHIA